MSEPQPASSLDQPELPTPLVLFDGVCRLCTGTVRFVITRDRHQRFRFASMQSPLGQRLLRRFGLPPDDLKTFVLVEANGHYTKSTAALRVARRMDGLWPGLYAFILVPRPIRDAFYDWVARNRYRWFGRERVCLRPEPSVKERFIDDSHDLE
ncbi:MAG: thiol-disulfide oxidoreductase DCC family protein [Nitrospirota bacterium]